MRPALLEPGPRSLVNLINTARLLRHGQKDAVLSFSCWVFKDGECGDMVTYRGTPGSLPLAEEVVDRAPSARFIAAVYKGEHHAVFLSGTVVFAVVAGKPHLRIFLNQEEEHLRKGDDFIAPQPVFYVGDDFDGFTYPEHDWHSGTVVVRVDTDATGKQLGARLIYEAPLGEGFGQAIMKKISINSPSCRATSTGSLLPAPLTSNSFSKAPTPLRFGRTSNFPKSAFLVVSLQRSSHLPRVPGQASTLTRKR